jgi:hypothetical protein
VLSQNAASNDAEKWDIAAGGNHQNPAIAAASSIKTAAEEISPELQ